MSRLLLLWSLLSSLVLTAPGAAQMRLMPDATGQMVLCIDGQMVEVFTDADGRPTAPPHPCPDCQSDLSFGLLPVLQNATGVATRETTALQKPDPLRLSTLAHVRARAPPSFF